MAIEKDSEWLILTCHLLIPTRLDICSTDSVNINSGLPSGVDRVWILVKQIPSSIPVPKHFSTASLTANLPNYITSFFENYFELNKYRFVIPSKFAKLTFKNILRTPSCSYLAVRMFVICF